MKKIKIGLVGCGTIGEGLIKQIRKRLMSRVSISCLCDVDPSRITRLKKKYRLRARVGSIADAVAQCDIVVEAASGAVAAVVAETALRAHKKALIMSVGGVLSIKGLSALLSKTRGELLLPSGAIAGLDALASARVASISRASITTSKPVKGLIGAPYFQKRGIDIAKIKKPTVVFQGTAAQAIKYFPKNINVAALLSLATLGSKKVTVSIVTSPTFTRNTHCVEVEGSFGKLTTTTENVPSPDNPKTSYLAVLSAYATLEKYVSSFKIGT